MPNLLVYEPKGLMEPPLAAGHRQGVTLEHAVLRMSQHEGSRRLLIGRINYPLLRRP